MRRGPLLHHYSPFTTSQPVAYLHGHFLCFTQNYTCYRIYIYMNHKQSVLCLQPCMHCHDEMNIKDGGGGGGGGVLCMGHCQGFWLSPPEPFFESVIHLLCGPSKLPCPLHRIRQLKRQRGYFKSPASGP